MDVFKSLWDNPEQRKRPPDDGFQLFTMDEWVAMSSTHKNLSGSLQCPLPPGIERPVKAVNQNLERKVHLNSKNLSSGNKVLVGPSGSGMINPQQSINTFSPDENPYVPGLVKLPELHRNSSLSRDEHQECLRLWLKFDGKSLEHLTPEEKAEYQLFQALYGRVKEEQKAYLECAKNHWPEYVQRTYKLKGDPNNYFKQYWVDKVARAMAQYPKNYRKLRMVSLDPQGKMLVQMHLIKNVLNIGKMPIVCLPELKKSFRISTSMVRLRTWALMNIPASHLNGILHKIPVSRDPNAERLARLHDANVVISSSAFRCLVDNYVEDRLAYCNGVGRSWIIPVTVKEHRSFSNGKPVTKCVVFVDKVLPLPKIASYDKVSWYQKQALMAASVRRHVVGGIEFEIKGTDITIRKGSDNGEGVAEDSHCEISPVSDDTQVASLTSQNSSDISRKDDVTDATSVNQQPPVADPPSSISDSPLIATPKCDDLEDDDDSADDSALFIATSDEETQSNADSNLSVKLKGLGTMEKTPHSGIITEKEELGNKSPESKILKVKEDKESTEKPNEASKQETKSLEKVAGNITSDLRNKSENVSAPPSVKTINGNALPPSFTNVTYNLWSLQSIPKETDKEHRHTGSDGSINMLIRSRVDGCEGKSGHFQPLSLASKPEYQLEFGAGTVPLSDLTRQWAKLIIQPNSLLGRVRVNVQNSEMVSVEKRTRSQLEQEAKVLYQKDLNDTLATLHGVISDLTKLSAGEYLLSHSPDMGSTAELFAKANEGETVDWDLAKEYGAFPIEIDGDVPWQPLDPSIIMPRNLYFKCMPCTFKFEKSFVAIPKKIKPPKIAPKTFQAFQKSRKKKNKNKKATDVTDTE